MKKMLGKLKYLFWYLNGFLGRIYFLNTNQKATILITYYNPERMRHIEAQVRNLLRCNFVEKIIISNHNPDFRIENVVKFRNERVLFINQAVHRGCGYRWLVASKYNPEYLIVIDDDIFLFPSQLTKLFKHLILEPDIPHGISGMLHQNDDSFEYHERENLNVDYICEVYAVTGNHLNQYIQLIKMVTNNSEVSEMIESSADFMLISQTGHRNPKIHKLGGILRNPTFNQTGIAVHKEKGFHKSMMTVYQALENIKSEDSEYIIQPTVN